jgi:adenylate cyclase
VANERVQRKLTTILAADVEGYSRLMRADEEGTLATLSAHREVIDRLIARHEGRIFNTAGDSVMAEFTSPVEAVRCAVACQDAVAGSNTELAQDRRLMFRIGINVGDVMTRDGDLFGDGVNVAARLEGLAPPGGVCVSGSVYEQVRRTLALDFEALGPQTVKNLDEPVTAYRLAPGAAKVGTGRAAKAKARAVPRGWRIAALAAAAAAIVVVAAVLLWPTRGTGPVTGKPSIAVLAFANLSRNPKENHLGPGIAGDVFTDIAKSPGLLVAPWEVSRRIDPGADPAVVGRRLNVIYVLTGDIRRTGGGLRARVRLVDTRRSRSLWADRYDRTLTQIPDLPAEIARKVLAALKLKSTGARRTRSPNTEVYNLLLQARAETERITPKANAAAIALLERAIELDPDYARAYAELAVQHFWKWNFGGARDPAILDRGVEIARKAIRIDPTLADAYAALGTLHRWRRHHEAALAAYTQAIKLDPNNGEILSRIGFTYMMAGDPAKGLKYIGDARQRTTYEPWTYAFWAAECYYYLDRNEDALREVKASIARNPRVFATFRFLSIVLFELGRLDEAKAAKAEALRLNPRVSIGYIKRILPLKNPADLERQIRAMGALGYKD